MISFYFVLVTARLFLIPPLSSLGISDQDGSSRVTRIQLARKELELYVITINPSHPSNPSFVIVHPPILLLPPTSLAVRHIADMVHLYPCLYLCLRLCRLCRLVGREVSAPELLRLKKRFMKLDKDGSGSIDKDEFLQIPQIANNPLAHRMIAIFDEE